MHHVAHITVCMCLIWIAYFHKVVINNKHNIVIILIMNNIMKHFIGFFLINQFFFRGEKYESNFFNSVVVLQEPTLKRLRSKQFINSRH